MERSAMPGNRDDAYPAWAFRAWHGMTLRPWFGLLARNRFAIARRRLPMAIDITLCAAMNSLFGFVQRLVYARAISRTAITNPPVFVIGHWRTGTTWLHEMLGRDPNFVAPTTYECLVPSHALLTAPIWALSRFRAPKIRPMDGMAVDYDRPQEDEFAMMNLGAGSFLETFAFPNHRPINADTIGLDELDARQRRRWIATRLRFLQQVLYRGQRAARRGGAKPHGLRLVLKTPQDTARLALLNSVFPGACFIHLVRDPEDIFASTMKLWRSMAETQALHRADWNGRPGTPSLDEFVLGTFERLYRNFQSQRRALSPSQIIDIRYEDLTRDPVKTLERIYTHFGWDKPPAIQTGQGERDPAARRYEVTPEIKVQIATRWGFYCERFGYSPAPSHNRAA
jgi:hypothetical protein